MHQSHEEAVHQLQTLNALFLVLHACQHFIVACAFVDTDLLANMYSTTQRHYNMHAKTQVKPGYLNCLIDEPVIAIQLSIGLVLATASCRSGLAQLSESHSLRVSAQHSCVSRPDPVVLTVVML